jgi:hypothetical protein
MASRNPFLLRSKADSVVARLVLLWLLLIWVLPEQLGVFLMLWWIVPCWYVVRRLMQGDTVKVPVTSDTEQVTETHFQPVNPQPDTAAIHAAPQDNLSTSSVQAGGRGW